MEEKIKSYKDLKIWEKSMALAKSVYKLTKEFPSDERYGIISQMQRAAVSVPVNIAEGWARKHTKEYIHFFYIYLLVHLLSWVLCRLSATIQVT